jgi:hypothetical protein
LEIYYKVLRPELEEMGFDYNLQPLGYGWDLVKRALQAYERIEGHLLVPKTFTIPEDDAMWEPDLWGMKLGFVVTNIRNSNQYAEHKAELEEMEFDFSPQQWGPGPRFAAELDEEHRTTSDMQSSQFNSLSGPDFVRMTFRQIMALSVDELRLLICRSQCLLAKALVATASLCPGNRSRQDLQTQKRGTYFGHLKFVCMERQQILELPLEELKGLVLRSQRLLAVALFSPAQCLFEVMPDEYVLHVLLEWLTIEDQARLDRALLNHKYRMAHLHLLRGTEHKGVISVSGGKRGYTFNSGVAEWLESRNVFMRALKFYDGVRDIPAGLLARTGRQLLQIDLDGCFRISDAGFSDFVKSCPRLEVVNISYTNITDEGVASLGQRCSLLHTLDLSGTGFTDSGLAALGAVCTDLKKINLAGSAVSDEGLIKLAEGCARLEDIGVSSCARVTDASLEVLGTQCTLLHTLDLSGTGITDTGLAVLGSFCKALTKINLTGLAVSDAGLSRLSEGCARLVDLNMCYCLNITDETMRSLGQHCPNLRSLCVLKTRVTPASIAALRTAYPHELKLKQLCDSDEAVESSDSDTDSSSSV